MRIASVGHAVYAATMIALGVYGLVRRDFTPVWEPVPKGIPAREVLVYVCAVVSLACGVGLLWKHAAAPAARALLGLMMLWFLLFRVSAIFRAPKSQDTWSGLG